MDYLSRAVHKTIKYLLKTLQSGKGIKGKNFTTGGVFLTKFRDLSGKKYFLDRAKLKSYLINKVTRK